MKEIFDHLVKNTINFLKHKNSKKGVIISSIVALLACLFFLLAAKVIQRSNMVTTSSYLNPTASSISTKWWIKATPSSPTKYADVTLTSRSADTPISNCSSDNSSDLQPGIFAYISLSPQLPNRIRSGAGKIYSYIGQIEPGTGIEIIDGPLCSDGYLWFLIEPTSYHLKGWTAMGKGSEQWIIPCADPNTPCSKIPINLPTSTTTPQDHVSNKCNSYVFTGGMFAKVKQSDLLVIRSEPHTGVVIGYAGPCSKVKILDGPSCTDGMTWWKVRVSIANLTGWTTEANLTPCSKEECP